MVYETDFYTVRRPYTRPTITSYSVTGCRPVVWRTTTISPVGAHSKVRLSVLLGELNRIQNRPRMHLSYVPTEDFLNSRPLVAFDDETKYIRAEADKLMRYIYVPVPHQTSRIPPKITTCYDRLTGNGLNPYRYGSGLSDNILNASYYNEPTRSTIGRGHLACVTFAGGRGYPRRKHLFADENRDIRDEIKVRSFYNKLVNPSTRIEESLALPTGFAARLLLSDRKPLSEVAEERKPKKPSRFWKTDIAEGLEPKKERITDKWLDPVVNNIADEPLKMKNNIEIAEETLIPKKRVEEDIILDANEEISNFEPVAPPPSVKGEKKSKKESRRKLSEKLPENEIIPETPKISKVENDISICEKDIEKPTMEETVVTPVPAEETLIIPSTPTKKDSVHYEQSLLRSTSQNEPKEIEEYIPDNDLEVEKKAEELINEEINKEDIQNVIESIPDVKSEELIIDNVEDKLITEEQDEVKVEDNIEEQIKEKEPEIKESEELKEILEEDISKSVEEQILESEQPNAEEEPKIESTTVETDDVLETSVDGIKEEPQESLNIEPETEPDIVLEDQQKEPEELTILDISKQENNQLDIEQPNDTQELLNESVIPTEDITENEPIIEEPLSPEDINIPQISDDIQTPAIQEEL